MPTPYPYQAEARDAVIEALANGATSPAVVLPTGTGKSLVIADTCKELRERRLPWGVGRMLILAHRRELVMQNAAEVTGHAPNLRVGVVMGQHHNGVLGDVISASVPTLRSPRRRPKDVSAIFVDECHHATADSYRMIRQHYPGVPMIGFTATMGRADGAALGDVWQDVVYKKDIAWSIQMGYLTGVRGVRVQVPNLDLRKLRKQRGDFAESALGEALEGSLAPKLIAEAYLEHAPQEQGILFAPTVHSARVMGEALAEAGISSGLVHGGMSDRERDAMLQRFRDGLVQVLVNCMVLTEGTNLPMATVAVMARMTLSESLYIQMAGRVLRRHPGKTRALILDVVGVTGRHSLMNPVNLFGESLRELEDVGLVDIDKPEEEQAAEDDLMLADDGAVAETDEPMWVEGETESVEIDLFGRSESAWQTTYAGNWFLPAGDRLIALAPGAVYGTYDVLWATRHSTRATDAGLTSGWIARGLTDLGQAMAAGEGAVLPGERMSTDKDRAWRGKGPNRKTLSYARVLGLNIVEGQTAGEVSALIAQAEASARLDDAQRIRNKTYGHGMVIQG